MLSDGDAVYTYDAAGRLLTLTQGATTYTYTYDGDGRRITSTSPEGTTKHHWDPVSYQLLADVRGATTTTYVHGLGPVAANDGSNWAYLHSDIQGTIRERTDSTGSVISTHSYEPFGVARPGSEPLPGTDRLGWSGQYLDPSGLSHLRARQYDPTTGEFQRPDPAWATQVGATYTYADSNPMTAGDPLGLWPDGSPSWGTLSYIGSNVFGLTPFGSVMAEFRPCLSDKGSCGADVVAAGVLGAAGVKGLSSVTRGARAAKGADEAGALVRYDAQAASRNLLGQVGDGYARTPSGYTVSAHAAERIVYGAPGRSPTTLGRVDDILNNPTRSVMRPDGSIRVFQGKDWVAVRGSGSTHIITVMVR